jgi:predicted phage tail component-like protein
MISFTFNEKNSYEDFGIVMKTRPSVSLPERNVNYIEIPGRNGSLTEDDETYKDITITVECFLYDLDNLHEQLDKIKGWLIQNKSDLVFSHNPNTKYVGQVVSSMDIKLSFKALGEFDIVFTCQPFSYPVFNPLVEIEEQNINVNNKFTFHSEPKITVYGQGNITLNISNYWGQVQVVTLNNVVDYITIDSSLMECYKGSTLTNNQMVGIFPILSVGENYISWVGNVQKIEILTNFRSV